MTGCPLPSFFLTLRIVPVMAAMLTAARAELTQQEVSTALGTPAGQTWTLTSPASAVWTASSAGLRLANASTGTVCAIETTVQGPGVASLQIGYDYGMYEISVWVDGVLSGNKDLEGTRIQRAEVGAGNHTIRWQIKRMPDFGGGPSIVLTNARWTPFAEQPLSTGVTGDGVVLTSSGTRPWTGQSAWHHGDGAAAWSGLRFNAAEGQTSMNAPLLATFEGPGVLGFRYRLDGTGYSTFKLDNAVTERVNSDVWVNPSGIWRTRWVQVGAGTHVMEWQAVAFSFGNPRVSYDMAVDEIRLEPAVSLADALETPGWNWSAMSAPQVVSSAAGIPDAGASGGSLARVGYGTRIVSHVSGGRLLKVRSRGGIPTVIFNSASTELTHAKNPAPGEWVDSIWALEGGDSDLTIYGDWDLEIDRVEFIPLPATLADALGVPEGSFSTGGEGTWNVAAYAEIIGNGARVKTVRGQKESWLEMPVMGPATLDFSWKTDKGNSGVHFLVDGKEADRLSSYGRSIQAKIELPSGAHTIRWLVTPPDASLSNADYSAFIGGIKVTPLPPGGIAMAALDLEIPFSIPTGWTASTGLIRSGGTVWQGPEADAPTSDYQNWFVTKASFTGPGELSFWWYAAKPANYPYVANWVFQKFESGDIEVERPSASGWKQQKLWLPPGTSLFEWRVSGFAEQVALTALDGIKFTPSPTVPLEEALDAPELVWQNDPAKPWLPLSLTNPAGDMVLSPLLAKGESSRFTTIVKGPGTVSFLWKNLDYHRMVGKFSVNGMRLNTYSGGSDDKFVEVYIPTSSPATLEWTATAPEGNGLIGVDEVTWKPMPVYSLAASLDAPASVTWKTSAGIPFIGWADPAAKGKTSAYIGLLPGEQSWLEATVEGPGLFDFWLRKQANMDLPGDLWEFWSLTIDGKPVAIEGTSWPAQWIAGAGKHQIRFTFTNSADEWIASGVDDVSWQPLQATSLRIAGAVPGQKWKTGKNLPATGLAASGRDGLPAILLRPGQGDASWLTTSVQGPCEISWDSALDPVENSVEILQVDGIDAAPFSAHPWKRMRLTLPKGNHSVRWISKPKTAAPDETDPPAAFASWRLSGITIKQGISPLAQALDFDGLFALETGDNGGHPILTGNEDAWEPGAASSLYFFDPHRAGKFTAAWGRPDNAWQQWEYQDSGGGYVLTSGTPGWHDHFTSIRPGTFVKWTYPKQAGYSPFFLKQLEFEGSAEKPVGLAIDSLQPLSDGGWVGLTDPEAVTGQDSAWSLLNRASKTQIASLTLTGPSKVSFWWKIQGPGTLEISLDGASLPVAAASNKWSKVEFVINPGEHVIQWKHAATEGIDFSNPSEAFLDGLKIVKAASHTLAQAAAFDPSLPLASIGSQEAALPWHPVAYREADGSWTEAVRAVAGFSALSVRVTGPAVLEFRGRCFIGVPETATRSKIAHSVIIITPGDGEKTLGHFLSVQVDATKSLKIQSDSSGRWTDGAVHVPEGTHEVTFRLQTLKSRWSEKYVVNATLENLQGWVDDLKVVSPANRFAEWARNENLTGALAGQDADPDDDGASNFLEYSFETNPRNAASRPAPMEMSVTTDHRDKKNHRRLKLPYLPSHVSGILQSSTDLSHWVDEPTPLLHYPPPAPTPIGGGEASAYPYVTVPIDAPQKLYRIWISDRVPGN